MLDRPQPEEVRERRRRQLVALPAIEHLRVGELREDRLHRLAPRRSLVGIQDVSGRGFGGGNRMLVGVGHEDAARAAVGEQSAAAVLDEDIGQTEGARGVNQSPAGDQNAGRRRSQAAGS